MVAIVAALTGCAPAAVAATDSEGAPAGTTALPYLVGAADTDITPTGVIFLGGNGLGDGSVLPDEVVGRGSTGEAQGERSKVRALVVDDGVTAVAIATIETQGVVVAYTNGSYGTRDVVTRVAEQVPALPVENQMLASNHTHSGPDTVGAWGALSEEYFATIRDQAVRAIVAFTGAVAGPR